MPNARLAGAKEAWGYSMSSFGGMWSIFGKKLDHAPWFVERATWIAIPLATFRYIGDYYELVLLMVCFLMKFMFLHQFSYNSMMSLLKMKGYGYNVKESANTTANIKSSRNIKIIFFLMGIIILFCHELVLNKIIPIFHPIK